MNDTNNQISPTKTSTNQDLPVIEDWTKFMEWLFDTSEKFPKSTRFTITSRIDNLALDILELLIEARYSKRQQKQDILKRANVALEKMRIMLRICHQKRYLANRSFEYCVRALRKCGGQIGNWHKEVIKRQ